MNMFIKVKDGKAVDHPIVFENFLQAYPHIDVNNLPPEFARFERIEPPRPGIYEVYEGVTYERVGDVFKDVHHIRPMTDEEKTVKQDEVKSWWNANLASKYPSWIFNEDLCKFVPPIVPPDDVTSYRWDEQIVSWVLIKE